MNNSGEKIENPLSGAKPGNHGGAMMQAESSKAVAEVQAALLVARANPRDQVKALDRIINAFSRIGLAEVSQYQYSRGGTDIVGPSIRSAEAIAQQWGNISFGFRELSRTIGLDGVGISEVSATAWDLETNTIRNISFQVRHWRDKSGGGSSLKSERDIYELIANQAQRRVRSCILAVIPTDVIDTGMRQAQLTLKASADTSDEAMKKMLEKFAEYGVSKEQIEKRIQRRIDSIQPGQVVTLRNIYNSLRDGMSRPADWFEPVDDEGTTESGNDEADALNKSAKQSKEAAANSTKEKPVEDPAPKEKEPDPAPQQEPAAQEEQQETNDLPFVTLEDALNMISDATTETAVNEVVNIAGSLDKKEFMLVEGEAIAKKKELYRKAKGKK